MGSRSALAPVKDGSFFQSVNLSSDITTVYTGAGYIIGFYVNVSPGVGTTLIKDGTNAIISIPVGLTAGTWIPLGDIEFLTSLVVDPDNSATGSITIVYQKYTNE